MLQGFKDDFVTLRKMFWPNERDKAEYAAARVRAEEEQRKFNEEWDANTKRWESTVANARKLGWATHRVRLFKDHEWLHMLSDVVRAGTEGRAIFINGKYHTWIDSNGTKGYFDFTDDEVEVIEFLNEIPE